MKFSVSAVLDGNIKKIWTLAMDTDLQNRAVGFSAMQVRETPLPQGGSLRIGNAKMGGFRSEWIEHPFEWAYPYQSRVERDYTKGPLKSFVYQAHLTPDKESFRLDQDVIVIPRNFFFACAVWFNFRFSILKGFRTFFSQIEKHLQGKSPFPIQVRGMDLSPPDSSQNIGLIGKMSAYGSSDLVQKVILWVLKAMPVDLSRIRPYRVAKTLGLDARETLVFFLRATKEGYFNLRWDILCPECRGPKEGASTLAGINRAIHCSSCNVDFEADFDRSVELTFSPTPALRVVSDDVFCLGSPIKTSHILCQQRLAPETNQNVQVQLEAGVYRIHAVQSKGSVLLRCTPTNAPITSLEVNFSPDSLKVSADGVQESTERSIDIAPGSIDFLFSSTGLNYELTARIEHAEWLEDIVSAAEVSAMQEFRDSFSSEVLRPGQEIAVKNLCFMFTDLKGSTSFYNEAGDAPAFGAVRDHFSLLGEAVRRHNGAIVKTIGDAIMAVFTTPLSALQSAADMQKEILNFNAQPGNLSLNLKIGLHAGPALAVNLNERLDYFGRTVNMAARTEGTCKGGDVVFTPVLLQAPGVVKWLKENATKLSKFKSSLKGFEEESELFRMIP